MKRDNIQKIMDAQQKLKVTCKCGHRVLIPKFLKKRICNWCGHWVYKNRKEEFKDRLLREIRK